MQCSQSFRFAAHAGRRFSGSGYRACRQLARRVGADGTTAALPLPAAPAPQAPTGTHEGTSVAADIGALGRSCAAYPNSAQSNNIVPFPLAARAPSPAAAAAATAAAAAPSAAAAALAVAHNPTLVNSPPSTTKHRSDTATTTTTTTTTTGAATAVTWLLAPATNAACLALTAHAVLLPGVPVPWQTLALPTLAAFFAYNFDYVKDARSDRDAANQSARAAFYSRHATPIWAAVRLSALGMAATAATMPAALGGAAAVLAAIGLLYSAPVLPGGRSLRTVTGVKTLVNVLGWGVAAVAVPLLAATPSLAAIPAASAPASASASASAATLVGFRGAAAAWAVVAHTAANRLSCLFGDIRDAAGDAAEGNATLAVLLGKERTLALVAGVTALEAGLKVALLGPALAAPLLASNVAKLAHIARFDESVGARDASYYLANGRETQLMAALAWGQRALGWC